MSYNGSGVFNINTAGQPVVTGTTISSTTFNNLTADLATGLTTALTKDGQSTPTANIGLGTYKIINLGAGTVASDAARLDQVQGGAATFITVAGTDTLTGTVVPALSAYATGNQFSFLVANTNTGAVTINVDGIGAKAITRTGTTALVAGDMVAGQAVEIIYDGTRFQLVNGNSFTNLKVSGTLGVTGVATFTGTVGAVDVTTTGNTILGDASTDTLNVGNGGLVKDASGNVGIGRTPVLKLDLGNSFTSQSSTGINSSTKQFRIGATEAGVLLTTDINTAGVASGTQTSSATLGYSYISPTFPTEFLIGTGTQTVASNLRFYNNNTERMRIDSSGNVGIDTSSPATKLDVNGDITQRNGGGVLIGKIWNDAGLYSVQANSANVSGLKLDAPGAQYISAFTNATERMRIDSSGNVGIGVTSPACILDISGATGGQIKFPATQNASANANTLDDYEEGTWTPTLVSTGATFAYTTQQGTYTKIGRQVTCLIRFQVSASGTVTNPTSIGALPFTVSAAPSGGGFVTFGNMTVQPNINGVGATTTAELIAQVTAADLTPTTLGISGVSKVLHCVIIYQI